MAAHNGLNPFAASSVQAPRGRPVFCLAGGVSGTAAAADGEMKSNLAILTFLPMFDSIWPNNS